MNKNGKKPEAVTHTHAHTLCNLEERAITLIALIITIIVLLILTGVALNFIIGENGILKHAEVAEEKTNKQTATEKMNLKITTAQMNTYAEEQRMPTLQEFADELCEDNEIQYVQLQSKKVASLSKIDVGTANSIFTKLKEYPYEFEINSSLQLASIDGIKVATNDANNMGQKKYSTEETIVGKWIDNKPIYQKTYVLTNLSGDNENKVFIIDENAKNYVETFVHSEIRMTRDEGNAQLASAYDYDKENHFTEIWFTTQRGFYIYGAFTKSVSTCHVTVQYTKTTN